MDNFKKYTQTGKTVMSISQFLSHFFKNKYGLNKLKNEAVNSFLMSLSRHTDKSSDCLVYKMILETQIDEDYWDIHESLKKNLKENLMTYLRKTNHGKSPK